MRLPTPFASAHPVAALLLGALCLWGAAGLSGADYPKAAQNGSLRLTVEGVRVAPSFGDNAAPAGRQWCVVRGRWENRIDKKRAAERGLATALDVSDLAKHLYLVVDGASLGALQHLDGVGGRSSLAAVAIEKPGAFVAGEMVFEIPAGAYTSAELRYYDDISGHFRLALTGAPPEAKPLGAVVRNAIAEFAVFAVHDPAPAAEDAAVPVGGRAVAIELRARSVWRTTGPAPEYDFSQPAGAQVERVNLVDWPGTRQSFVLVADGEYAATPVGGTLPDDARFLPELFTGGTLVFHVPAEAKSLELIGTLGHAATEAGVMDFVPVRLPVSGGAAKPAPWTMPLRLTDEMFTVAVGARRVASFAGEPAGEDREFVVLDVGVENTSAGGEYFQPEAQLQLVDAEGGLTNCDEITGRGPRSPGAQLYVPAGMRRRCELVFRVAKGASPKLNFRGGSFEAQHDLP